MDYLDLNDNILWITTRELQLYRGVDTNGDGHHDGGVVGRGGQFPLSANALSGQNMH